MTAQPHPESGQTAQPDRTPAGIRRCLLPEDVPLFDAEFRAACREVADGGIAELEAVQTVLRRWYTTARFSMDPGGERARRAAEGQILAGEYTGGSSWPEAAARLGIPVDGNGLLIEDLVPRDVEPGEG